MHHGHAVSLVLQELQAQVEQQVQASGPALELAVAAIEDVIVAELLAGSVVAGSAMLVVAMEIAVQRVRLLA